MWSYLFLDYCCWTSGLLFLPVFSSLETVGLGLTWQFPSPLPSVLLRSVLWNVFLGTGGWVGGECMSRAFKQNCPPSICCAWVSTGMRRLDNWGGAKGQRWSLGLERNWEFLADTSCSPVLYPPTQFSGPFATSSFLCRIVVQKQACTIGQMCVHQYKVKAHTDESEHLLCFCWIKCLRLISVLTRRNWWFGFQMSGGN